MGRLKQRDDGKQRISVANVASKLAASFVSNMKKLDLDFIDKRGLGLDPSDTDKRRRALFELYVVKVITSSLAIRSNAQNGQMAEELVYYFLQYVGSSMKDSGMIQSDVEILDFWQTLYSKYAEALMKADNVTEFTRAYFTTAG